MRRESRLLRAGIGGVGVNALKSLVFGCVVLALVVGDPLLGCLYMIPTCYVMLAVSTIAVNQSVVTSLPVCNGSPLPIYPVALL